MANIVWGFGTVRILQDGRTWYVGARKVDALAEWLNENGTVAPPKEAQDEDVVGLELWSRELASKIFVNGDVVSVVNLSDSIKFLTRDNQQVHTFA